MAAVSRLIALRYSAHCHRCGQSLPATTPAWWDARQRSVTCASCHGAPALALSGTAGASAQAEYERRGASEWFETRGTSAWAKGAEGERRIAHRLDPLVDEGMVVMHDRKLPGTRANIDHIVVAPSGVYVIDAKHWSGKIGTRTTGSVFKPGPTKLVVGGRDRTDEVNKTKPQHDAVVDVIARSAIVETVPVWPVICTVEAEWPLLARPIRLDRVTVTWMGALLKDLRRPGPLARDGITRVSAVLNEGLPR